LNIEAITIFATEGSSGATTAARAKQVANMFSSQQPKSEMCGGQEVLTTRSFFFDHDQHDSGRTGSALELQNKIEYLLVFLINRMYNAAKSLKYYCLKDLLLVSEASS
jgi:hypothetical protein